MRCSRHSVALALALSLLCRAVSKRSPLEDKDFVLIRATCQTRLELAHATGRASKPSDIRAV